MSLDSWRKIARICCWVLGIAWLGSLGTCSAVGYQFSQHSLALRQGTLSYAGGTLLKPSFPEGWVAFRDSTFFRSVSWHWPRWHEEPGWIVRALPLWIPWCLALAANFFLRRRCET